MNALKLIAGVSLIAFGAMTVLAGIGQAAYAGFIGRLFDGVETPTAE